VKHQSRKQLPVVVLLVPFLAASLAGRAAAKTPDGQTPAQETVCDQETGAAFGLCNAYCEAMDCDSPDHRASANACANVKRNFVKKTGRPLPCDVQCPCGDHLPVFEAIASGTATIELCFIDTEFIVVAATDATFTAVWTGPPATCDANLQPPAVELTTTEQLVCRVALQTAAAAQGVPCLPPE
jgi:hypothetical protein